MSHSPPEVLAYAEPGVSPPRPTRHSPLAGWAWAVLLLEIVYRGGVIAYAHYRSPTYPWARFYRNVGDPDLFVAIDRAIFCAGALLAILAFIPSHRKRWAAWGALAAHLYLLATEGGLLENTHHGTRY